MTANVDLEYEAYWRYLLEQDRLQRLTEFEWEHDLWIYESETIH